MRTRAAWAASLFAGYLAVVIGVNAEMNFRPAILWAPSFNMAASLNPMSATKNISECDHRVYDELEITILPTGDLVPFVLGVSGVDRPIHCAGARSELHILKGADKIRYWFVYVFLGHYQRDGFNSAFKSWRLAVIFPVNDNINFERVFVVAGLGISKINLFLGHISPDLRFTNATGLKNGTSGKIGGGKGSTESQYSYEGPAKTEIDTPVSRFLGGIRSLPLSAKIGLTFIAFGLTWLSQLIGFIRLLDEPKRWQRYVYLFTGSLIAFLSPAALWV